MRYVSPKPNAKNISKAEAQALQAAGFDVILIFESTATRMLDGYDAGVADAKTAISVATEAGAPKNFFCYFACDFDASPSQQPLVNAYLDGAATVMGGVRRIGFYGGYGPVKRVLDAGKAAKAWQSSAWSAGKIDPRITLYQDANISVGIDDCDFNYGYSTDLGQWPVAYDGKTPAAGTTGMNRAAPATPPIQGDSSDRDAAVYDNVINQFAVGVNPRYQPTAAATYCNIFAWDVTRAMTAEIPHWVDRQDNPVAARQPSTDLGDRELTTNATVLWLREHGAAHGWHSVDAGAAQSAANGGHPTVVAWYHAGGHGHIAAVRPGTVTDSGPAIAQAGAKTFNQGHVYDSFSRSAAVGYWTHD